MEDFFKQLIEDLKEICGIQQLHWLKKECADMAKDEAEAVKIYERKKKVLIRGMVLASREYPYIPEEDQKQIIEEQCSKDQNFEHLDSRVIHKWLSLHKDRFWSKRLTEEDLMQKRTAPVLSLEEAQPYIKQIEEIIANVGRKVPQVTKEEAEKLGADRIKDPVIQELKVQIGTGAAPRPEWIVGEECPKCLGDRVGPDNVDCNKCGGVGKINWYTVNASSQEEADKAYEEFKNQNA